MKKIIAVLLLMAMLLCVSACGGQPTQTKHEFAEYNPSGASGGAEKEEFSTDYTIETVGEPDLNENGEVIGDCHFEKLVFTNPNKILKKINSQISDICDDFVWGSTGESYREYLNADSEFRADELVKCPYFATADVANVYIEDDYLCILMATNWYCGGVHNLNYIGLNYNLKTGEEMRVAELFDDAATASDVIIEATLDYMSANAEIFFEGSTETVMNYNVNDYNFSFDEDTISILYDTYELAPGACGPITVTIPR